jgi:hypothetical protein
MPSADLSRHVLCLLCCLGPTILLEERRGQLEFIQEVIPVVSLAVLTAAEPLLEKPYLVLGELDFIFQVPRVVRQERATRCAEHCLLRPFSAPSFRRRRR